MRQAWDKKRSAERSKLSSDWFSELREIRREHDARIDKIHHWKESSRVLQCLKSAHKKRQVFVARRAAEIPENPWINGDMSKASKTLQILAQEGCPSKTSRTPGG